MPLDVLSTSAGAKSLHKPLYASSVLLQFNDLLRLHQSLVNSLHFALLLLLQHPVALQHFPLESLALLVSTVTMKLLTVLSPYKRESENCYLARLVTVEVVVSQSPWKCVEYFV